MKRTATVRVGNFPYRADIAQKTQAEACKG